jgi:hypothetical protein
VQIGVMKRYFEILSEFGKRRYSNTALRFPSVPMGNPSVYRGFDIVPLAGYARTGAHARPHMRKDTPFWATKI